MRTTERNTIQAMPGRKVWGPGREAARAEPWLGSMEKPASLITYFVFLLKLHS